MTVRRRGSSLQRPAIACALAVSLACPSALDATEPADPAPETPAQPAPELPLAPPADDRAPSVEATPPARPRAEAAPEPGPAAPRQPPPPATPSAQSAQAPTAPPAGPTARAAASASVAMQDFSFAPQTVSVNTGDSVRWTNDGQAPHTATGDGFDTGTVQAGASASVTFSSAGTFAYVCSIHPNMRGTVRVASSGGGGGGNEDDASETPASPSATNPPGASSASDASPAQTGEALPASGQEAWIPGYVGLVLLALGSALRCAAAPER